MEPICSHVGPQNGIVYVALFVSVVSTLGTRKMAGVM